MSQHTQDPSLRAALDEAGIRTEARLNRLEHWAWGDTPPERLAPLCVWADAAASVSGYAERTPVTIGTSTPAHAPGKAGDREGLIAKALETFQKRDGYHKAVIVEILEDFGSILLDTAALASSPTGNEAPRGEDREAAAAERYRAGAMDMRQTAGDAVNAMAHKMRGSGKDPLAAAALGDAVLAIRALPLAAAPPPPVSTEPDSRAGAEEALRILRKAQRSGLMPGCMMPDGAEPCAAFTEYDDAIRDAIEALRPSPPTASGAAAPVGEALADIAAERRRQVEAEGWTPEHDDAHGEGELADAAACYAAGVVPMAPVGTGSDNFVSLWPWLSSWWKPTNRRRNLVKAGALIVAEIERLDRATPTPAPHPVPAGQTTGEV